jgi:hypothetical protein
LPIHFTDLDAESVRKREKERKKEKERERKKEKEREREREREREFLNCLPPDTLLNMGTHCFIPEVLFLGGKIFVKYRMKKNTSPYLYTCKLLQNISKCNWIKDDYIHTYYVFDH